MNHQIKILALNGSPHRQGNTVALMRWVAEGTQKADAVVEWLHVVDYHIEYCLGCNSCLKQGVCPQKDDFPQVRERLLSADGIIAGSPVYEGGPSAQMKTLLDRLTLLSLFTLTFEGKWCVGVATSGIAPTGGVAADLSNSFGFSGGHIGATTSTIKHGYRPLDEFHQARLPNRAQALGQKLVARIQTSSRPGLHLIKWQWIRFLHNAFIQPMVTGHPEQFGGVLQIWREKGWLNR